MPEFDPELDPIEALERSVAGLAREIARMGATQIMSDPDRRRLFVDDVVEGIMAGASPLGSKAEIAARGITREQIATAVQRGLDYARMLH